jgi:hypothetical protein
LVPWRERKRRESSTRGTKHKPKENWTTAKEIKLRPKKGKKVFRVREVIRHHQETTQGLNNAREKGHKTGARKELIPSGE